MNNWSSDNGNYNFYGFPAPELAATVPLNTQYIQMTWQDVYGGNVAYDVYESLDQGLHWNLVAVTAVGVNIYQHTTFQNALVSLKIAPTGTDHFSNIVTIYMPLCLTSNQAVPAPAVLNNFNIAPGRTVHIEWGDGLFDDLVGANAAFPHVYVNPGFYTIQISGDVDFITTLDINTQFRFGGVLEYWILPGNLLNLNLNGCTFAGNLNKWILPGGLLTFDIGNNLFTGDLSGWFTFGGMPPGLTTFVLTTGNFFTGTPPDIFAGATLPAGIINIDAQAMGFTGNLRNFLIPAGAAPIDINFHDNQFGSILRGNYRWVRTMNMSDNYVSYQELNDFLAYLDNFFRLGVVPLVNLTLTLTGANMGSPEGGAVNNDAIVSLTAKYIAAAVVFACVCN